MNFDTTTMLLDAIKPYMETSTIHASVDNKDWRNRRCTSDLVTIDAENHVGFEVFDNEIIVFYFTDHRHFEDYTVELQDGQETYIERAISFLQGLLEYKVRHVEYYKGKSIYYERYFLVHLDGEAAECIGNTWFGFLKRFNPFGKKTAHTTVWQFDQSQGCFRRRNA